MHEKIKTKPRATEVDVQIGKTIKKIRILNGYSQEHVANEMNITFQQIQKYERGTNRISASRMYALSKILDVGIQEFFMGLDAHNTSNASEALASADVKTLKLLMKFNQIDNPKIKKLIISLLKNSG